MVKVKVYFTWNDDDSHLDEVTFTGESVEDTKEQWEIWAESRGNVTLSYANLVEKGLYEFYSI